MKKLPYISIIILLLIWLEPTLARTYRWVDENGVTIYSQSPPPSGKATIIKTPPPSYEKPGDTLKNLKARLKDLEEGKKKKNQTKEQSEKEEKNAAIKEQNCQAAKNNLKVLNEHGRIRKKMPDGSYKALPDEERTAELERAKAEIAKNCK